MAHNISEFSNAHNRLQQRRAQAILCEIRARSRAPKDHTVLLAALVAAAHILFMAFGMFLATAYQDDRPGGSSSHRLSTPNLWSKPQ